MNPGIESPARDGNHGGADKLGKLDSADFILTQSRTQDFRIVVLQRRHCLAASRATLIAELHFGGAA